MTHDFNKNWYFNKADGTQTIVNLPHDAMLEEQRDPNCHNAKHSGYFPGGKYVYTKAFHVETKDLDKDIELLFEGVYQNARILINDIEVKHQRYGYSEFTVNISNHVQAGLNHVTVKVDNSLEPNCRWYTGSGIYRPVTLSIQAKPHPSVLKVVTLGYDPVVIDVIADKEANIRILDGDKVIASGKAGTYALQSAQLWSAESPKLYTCESSLGDEMMRTSFGIRHLTWHAETGLCINGQEVKLRGGCIHHDNGVIGACSFKDAEFRRVRILKEAGFNAIRSAHNPASRFLLDACDQLGMYVIDEAFDGWYIPKTYHDYARYFEMDWKKDITAMVEKDFNHPSVIAYSIGNEVSETASEKGVTTVHKLVDHIKTIDGTRPITIGINVLLNVYANMGLGVYKDKGSYHPQPLPKKQKGYRERATGSLFFNNSVKYLGGLMFYMSKGKKGDRASSKAFQYTDIAGLNYAASRYDEDLKNYPQRLMMGSETMITDLPYNWERVMRHKAIIGDFVWAAWDYLGEAGVGDWLYHSYPGLPLLAGSGLIDITGKIGPESYYQQIIWGLYRKPYLCVRPLNHTKETPTKSPWRFTDAIESWTWDGYEGLQATVEVYSNAPTIRLILNGKILGEQKVKNFKTLFKIGYEAGVLEAIAIDEKGNEISRNQLKTAEKSTILHVVPETTTLKADGQSLCYIPIEFSDRHGNLKPTIEHAVSIQVDGEATLMGFGSAIIKTDQSYQSQTFNAYRGRCLAVIRSHSKPGSVQITVSAQGYEPVSIQLEVI